MVSGVGPAAASSTAASRAATCSSWSSQASSFAAGGGDRVGQVAPLQQQVDEVCERAGGQVTAGVAVGEQRPCRRR